MTTAPEPLLTIEIQALPPVDMGSHASGTRRVVPFAGGRFSGRDGLRGELAPGGADYQTLRPDGVLDIDAHYVLITDAGAAIEVHSTGVRDASPQVAARIAAGEPVDPAEYYFRTHIRLTTAAPRWAWMNRRIFVSHGRREQSRVIIEVYEIP